jgi:hypothetical protein
MRDEMDPTLANELPGIIARLIFYIVLVVATIIPSWRIFRRAGLSPWWSLFSFIPAGMIVILWIVAYRKWPKVT